MIDLNAIQDLSHIVSETLPTTRIDGSALLIGDRWYKPSLGREGFWNGTLWLGDAYLISSAGLSMGGTANTAIGAIPLQGSIFVESWKTGFFTATAISDTNYVTHRLRDSANNIISTLSFQTFDTPFVAWRSQETLVNAVAPQNEALNTGSILFEWVVTGTVNTRFGYVSVAAREILS